MHLRIGATTVSSGFFQKKFRRVRKKAFRDWIVVLRVFLPFCRWGDSQQSMVDSLFYLFVFYDPDESWEVVGIAIGPNTARVGAERVAFVATFLLFEEIFVEDFGFPIAESFTILVEPSVRYDDLVEKIPLVFIGERADALLVESIGSVEEFARIGLFDFGFCAKFFSYRWVDWVVV